MIVGNLKLKIKMEKIKNPKNVARGKKSRKSGAAFELQVRKDLESKGWIVAKWSNNVDLITDIQEVKDYIKDKLKSDTTGILVPARHKFRGIGIPMAMGTGFPDFIAFQKIDISELKDVALVGNESRKEYPIIVYEIIGVEAKSNGYLDKTEKLKCNWLLSNNIFSKILIAKKIKEERRMHIDYVEYKI